MITNNSKQIIQSLKDKISEFKGFIKNKTVYSKHDFTKSSTIIGNKIVEGLRNVDMKRNIARNNYLTFFDEYCKTKSISDIIDMITGKNIIKYFSNKQEINSIKNELDSQNRENKRKYATPSFITIEDLFDNLGAKCFMPENGEISSKTLSAFSLLTSQTQTIHRVISFINSNIQAIFNKCDLTASENSPNSLKKFENLMEILKIYQKEYHSYYKDSYLTSINENTSTKKDPNFYNDEDIYDRMYEISQIKSNNLVNENINSDIKLINNTQQLLQNVNKNTISFVELMENSQELKKENIDLQEKVENVNKAIENNKNYLNILNNVALSKDKSCEKELQKPWIGVKSDKDIAKKAYERQSQIKNSLEEIAKQFMFFNVNSQENPISPYKFSPRDGSDLFTEEQCKLYYVGENTSVEGLSGLIDIIRTYQNDDSIQNKNNLLKVYSFNDENGLNQDKIFTESQMNLIESVYTKLKEYYNQNGTLEQFAYQSAKHSIYDEILIKLQKVFENDFKNNTKLEDLNIQQIESLYEFIRINEPVKGLFTKDQIIQYEIDSRLIKYLSTEENCKKIIDFINLKILENNISLANQYQKENTSIKQNCDIQIQANIIQAENDIKEAKKIKESLSSMQSREKAFSQDVANFQNETNQLISNIANDMETPDYQQLSTDKKINVSNSSSITPLVNKSTERLNTLNSDVETLSKNSSSESIIDLYKKYLSNEQKQSFAEYIKTLDTKTIDYFDAQLNMF